MPARTTTRMARRGQVVLAVASLLLAGCAGYRAGAAGRQPPGASGGARCARAARLADARLHAVGHPVSPAGLAVAAAPHEGHGSRPTEAGELADGRRGRRGRRHGSECEPDRRRAWRDQGVHGSDDDGLSGRSALAARGIEARGQGPFHDRCAAPGDRRHREAAVDRNGGQRMARASDRLAVSSARRAHRLCVGEPQRRVSRGQRGGRGALGDEDRVEPRHRAGQGGRGAAAVLAAAEVDR